MTGAERNHPIFSGGSGKLGGAERGGLRNHPIFAGGSGKMGGAERNRAGRNHLIRVFISCEFDAFGLFSYDLIIACGIYVYLIFCYAIYDGCFVLR